MKAYDSMTHGFMTQGLGNALPHLLSPALTDKVMSYQKKVSPRAAAIMLQIIVWSTLVKPPGALHSLWLLFSDRVKMKKRQ